ncbi:zinc-binding dehydrogenase, partial [Pseudomonas viridiflava]|uniref:zinc-binding dehydrogenase n=1 Tax=Pseudomonas viridiflava TaxID=33069 RepID=UPI0013DED536
AKAVGATVLATTSSAQKTERLLALGADKVVNYLEEPQRGDRVRSLAQGQGVERIVEVGGPGTLAQSPRGRTHRFRAPGGRPHQLPRPIHERRELPA